MATVFYIRERFFSVAVDWKCCSVFKVTLAMLWLWHASIKWRYHIMVKNFWLQYWLVSWFNGWPLKPNCISYCIVFMSLYLSGCISYCTDLFGLNGCLAILAFRCLVKGLVVDHFVVDVDYETRTLLKLAVSRVGHVSMSYTNTTPTLMITLNYTIFSNLYRCRRVGVVFGVCVRTS
jgi:hypothetical protein